MSGSGLTAEFLSRLAGDGPLPGAHVAAILAHADDETLGLGAQLPRLAGITLVHVTDGAPRDLADATRKGFATAEDYARARRGELEAAVALAGVPRSALVSLGYADQDAAFNLVSLTRRIAGLVAARGLAVVLTHAYEGGHPDHDATAFAVHAAVRLLPENRRPLVVEMPFYRAGPQGFLPQLFDPDPGAPAITLRLDVSERRLKARMYRAHRSQADVLSRFPIAAEHFRPAPLYDFSILPNGGDLYYERQDWGLTGPRWLSLVAAAQATLAEASA